MCSPLELSLQVFTQRHTVSAPLRHHHHVLRHPCGGGADGGAGTGGAEEKRRFIRGGGGAEERRRFVRGGGGGGAEEGRGKEGCRLGEGLGGSIEVDAVQVIILHLPHFPRGGHLPTKKVVLQAPSPLQTADKKNKKNWTRALFMAGRVMKMIYSFHEE